MNKWEDLLAVIQKKEDEKAKNTVLWILAIIGAVAAVAGIAVAVYKYLTPDYLEDFDEDFDDDFDDYFEDELEEEKEEEAPEEDKEEEEIFVDEEKKPAAEE